jgi:hypothetical protein
MGKAIRAAAQVRVLTDSAFTKARIVDIDEQMVSNE